MKWISVKEKMPEEGEPVFASDGRGIVKAQYEGVVIDMPVGGWWTLKHISGKPVVSGNITHWMPLLELPKDEAPA